MYHKRNSVSVLQRVIGQFLYRPLSTHSESLKLENLEFADWTKAQSFKEIPGPTKYGLIRGFMPGGDYYKKSFIDYILKSKEQYGDIYRIPGLFGKEDIVMTFNVDDFQRVFRTEGIWPARPGAESMKHYRKTYQAELYDKAEGLLNSQGEKWGTFRTAVNPVLMQPRNAKLYVTPMQQVNTEFLQRIRKVRDPTTHEVPDNFIEEINRLNFESVAVVALNTHLGLLRENNDSAKEFFNSFKTLLRLMIYLDFQPSVWKYVWTPTFARYKKCLDVVYETTTRYVTEALKRLEDQKRVSPNENTELSVLEKLLKIDKSIAVVMAIDILMGGIETTAFIMSGILLQVAKNTEKQAKLREEVRRVLPEKDSLFTIESMQHLPYLRACIKEGIRMHPIGPGNARYSGANLVLCGYQIPKGTQVIMNSNLLLKDENYFTKPNEFIPERWIRDTGMGNPITPFSYMPFGFGPRMCVGKRIVELELEVTLARLVRNFYMEFNYPMENAFRNYFQSTKEIPLKFKFIDVEN